MKAPATTNLYNDAILVRRSRNDCPHIDSGILVVDKLTGWVIDTVWLKDGKEGGICRVRVSLCQTSGTSSFSLQDEDRPNKLLACCFSAASFSEDGSIILPLLRFIKRRG